MYTRGDCRGDRRRDSRPVYTLQATGRRDDRSDSRGDDRPVYASYNGAAGSDVNRGRHKNALLIQSFTQKFHKCHNKLVNFMATHAVKYGRIYGMCTLF